MIASLYGFWLKQIYYPLVLKLILFNGRFLAQTRLAI